MKKTLKVKKTHVEKVVQARNTMYKILCNEALKVGMQDTFNLQTIAKEVRRFRDANDFSCDKEAAQSLYYFIKHANDN